MTHANDLQNWVTDSGGDGSPALPPDDIQENLDDVVSMLGTLTSYLGDIPDSATGRPNGIFYDPGDLTEYLQSGGLVFLNPETGDPVPNPIVYIYRNVDPDTGEVEYEVYIDDESA